MAPEQTKADRLSGVFFILFGAVLFWGIVPWQIETVDYGWLRPRTLPRILAVIIIICGVWQMLTPGENVRTGEVPWLRALVFVTTLVLGLAAISRFGFLWIAPVMAFAIMWLARERRPFWLALGTAGMPTLIWLGVSVLLERPLP